MPKPLVASAESYREIPLSQLRVSEDNARQRERTADIDELADSIRSLGLLQPIVVQKRGEEYEVLIGQRRYLAAKQLRLQKIMARVLPKHLKEIDAKALSFSENVQRRDLTPRDKAEVAKYLHDQLGSVRAVAERIGVTDQTVRRWLEYEAVPEELKTLVDKQRITRPLATRIAQHVTDSKKAVEIAERIAEIKPSKAQRERILEAVEEFPDQSADFVVRQAQRMRTVRRINFILHDRYAKALRRASDDLSMDPNDIARDATIDWLRLGRYVL